MFIFNRNRYIALASMIMVSVLIWYKTILLTNDYESKSLPIPTKTQYFGLILGIGISFFYWLKQCMTIIPST